MKYFLEKNSSRYLVRLLFAILVAGITDYYFSRANVGWILFSTAFVMLTSTGSALYQGLIRYLSLIVIIIAGSIVFSLSDFLYARLFDVTLGAVIGIVINLMIFPDRVDFEFRQVMAVSLQSYSNYFSSVIALLLERQLKKEDSISQSLPSWVYEAGFDITLQKSYRHFLLKTDQISEILLSMHHLARHSFDETLLEKIRDPLLQCTEKVQQFFSALIKVLTSETLGGGVDDFAAVIFSFDNNFREAVPLLA